MTLNLAAPNAAGFDLTELTAPADETFYILFSNNDPGVPHHVQINDASRQMAFTGPLCNGGATRWYEVPALPAGTYTYICTVHPNMKETLTVD